MRISSCSPWVPFHFFISENMGAGQLPGRHLASSSMLNRKATSGNFREGLSATAASNSRTKGSICSGHAAHRPAGKVRCQVGCQRVINCNKKIQNVCQSVLSPVMSPPYACVAVCGCVTHAADRVQMQANIVLKGNMVSYHMG